MRVVSAQCVQDQVAMDKPSALLKRALYLVHDECLVQEECHHLPVVLIQEGNKMCVAMSLVALVLEEKKRYPKLMHNTPFQTTIPSTIKILSS